MKIFEIIRSLHRDKGGLTIAEMMMVAAAVVIPLIIVATFFGGQIVDSLKSGTSDTETKAKSLSEKWGS